MSIGYLAYLPSFLADLQELQALGTAEDVVMTETEDTLRNAGDHFYVESMPADTLSRWESMLGLASGNGIDLVDRRFRLLTYMISQTPFTITRLGELLADLCGEDGYSVALVDKYTLVVRVSLTSRLSFSSVVSLLERVVPANLLLDTSLLYNTHEFVQLATHSTLSQYTHQSIKEEERVSWQL
ncbi:DUF2313 domain-containing protein [Bengtsoniella intestinalis]|uniref:putative phage tail protein n=1 Tax=Bengtsoniella intestinalis TaxID=3073143 RepID=UPI00391EE92E